MLQLFCSFSGMMQQFYSMAYVFKWLIYIKSTLHGTFTLFIFGVNIMKRITSSQMNIWYYIWFPLIVECSKSPVSVWKMTYMRSMNKWLHTFQLQNVGCSFKSSASVCLLISLSPSIYLSIYLSILLCLYSCMYIIWCSGLMKNLVCR